jgi:NAD+ diphosphatase
MAHSPRFKRQFAASDSLALPGQPGTVKINPGATAADRFTPRAGQGCGIAKPNRPAYPGLVLPAAVGPATGAAQPRGDAAGNLNRDESAMSNPDTTPLPFSRAVLGDRFTAGTPDGDQPDQPGFLLALRDNDLIVRETGGALSLPYGPAPITGPWAVPPVFIGTWQGRPLRAGRLVAEAAIAAPYRPVPAGFRPPRLDDDLLTLAGMARQILHWRNRSRLCSVCGGSPREIPGGWGMRCPSCAREYYPRIHPAIIVLIIRGEEFLLVRKAEWPAGQFGLVAGFVEFGESLEECVAREVLEETGITVTDIRYCLSQSWPFPSQIMVGFCARYAGGAIVLDGKELEDAAWFRADRLPPLLPPRASVARAIIDRYAPGLGTARPTA